MEIKRGDVFVRKNRKEKTYRLTLGGPVQSANRRVILEVLGSIVFSTYTDEDDDFNYEEALNSPRSCHFLTKHELCQEWVKEEPPFLPKKGEMYFFVNFLGEIGSQIWNETVDDWANYDAGNCFSTKEQGAERSELIKNILKGNKK